MKTSINVSHCSYTAFAQYSFYQLGVVFSQLLVCNHNDNNNNNNNGFL